MSTEPTSTEPVPVEPVPAVSGPAEAPVAVAKADEQLPAAEDAQLARQAPIDLEQVGALLAQHFPALFGGPPQPIKLRVHADIQQRAPGVFTRRALSAFLHRHTTSTAYLIALSKAAHRVDLDGQPAGELSPEHRETALAELARRRAVRQERRAQQAQSAPVPAERRRQQLEDQQRRNRAHLLRDFETSTLTRANFCVLKGVPPEELDGLLELARRERGESPPSRPTSR